MAAKLQETGTMQLASRSVGYTVFRSAKRKRTISFFIESENRLRILAPLRTNQRMIVALLQERSSWISRKLDNLRLSSPAAEPHFVEGNKILYMGHLYCLGITCNPSAPRGCQLRPRHMTVNLHNQDLTADEKCAEVRLEILLWMKRRARIKLEQRMQLWSARMGVTYKRFTIGSPQRRWGSCSYRNDIRLNWRLIMAPLSVIDYVVVHELSHVAHKNHSPRFWNYVAKNMPDYQARQQLLKKISGQMNL